MNGYPAPHLLLILDNPVRIKLHKGPSGNSWRIDDPAILRRLGKDPASRKIAIKDYKRAIKMNPIWKHGFFDVQGVVKGSELKKHKNAFIYLFKYLVKCLDVEKYPELDDMHSFNDSTDKGLLTTLHTHLGNKCFRTRDISFGKGFKDRLGLLPPASTSDSVKYVWKRIKTVPSFTYEGIKDAVEISNTTKLVQVAT